MSHHLDTPLAAQDGQLFIDDLYVFGGRGSTVFVLDVNSDVTGAFARPGFHPEARYEFKVHVDGGEFEELTFRVAFGEPEADGRQPLQLYTLTGADARDDGAGGTLVLQGRTGEAAASPLARIWAGRVHDPFYIDLGLLSKINAAMRDGTAPDLSSWRPGEARNSFSGTTVESIVLEIPHAHPVLRPGERIGVWAATRLATDAGGWRQVNRGGHPMMWPIFWPDDVRFDDPANTRHPADDLADDGKHLADHVAAVVAAGGTAQDPHGYGTAVAWRLYPDVLPYVVGTPASYGFSGFNGRTLADNAPEVMLSLVTNTAVPSGLGPSVSAHLRPAEFPYLVPA
ncbi:MAG TPA: DUF4331 family protein [Dactylosporangium sp.]|jgi:hypothetical protein|nr:DUF4331 family protein [Dactylosporangium sp.]